MGMLARRRLGKLKNTLSGGVTVFNTTADNLNRFMQCNGSRLLKSRTVTENDYNLVREEGIAAHWFINEWFNNKKPIESLLNSRAENGIIIDDEMFCNVNDYMTAINQADSFVERDTSYQSTNFYVGGRADNIQFEGDALVIREFKYGYTFVEPQENWTMIYHATAMFSDNELMRTRTFNNVRLEVYQPRAFHPLGEIRTVTYSKDDFLVLAGKLADSLNHPDDKLNTGAACYKCPSQAFCPAFNATSKNALETSSDAFEQFIDDENLSIELDNIERALEVLKQLQASYTDEAIYRLRKGKILKNRVLENTYSAKKWKSTMSPDLLSAMTGRDDLVSKKMLTPTQVIKKGVTTGFVDAMSEREYKGVKLIKYDTSTIANKYFKG